MPAYVDIYKCIHAYYIDGTQGGNDETEEEVEKPAKNALAKTVAKKAQARGKRTQQSSEEEVLSGMYVCVHLVNQGWPLVFELTATCTIIDVRQTSV